MRLLVLLSILVSLSAAAVVAAPQSSGGAFANLVKGKEARDKAAHALKARTAAAPKATPKPASSQDASFGLNRYIEAYRLLKSKDNVASGAKLLEAAKFASTHKSAVPGENEKSLSRKATSLLAGKPVAGDMGLAMKAEVAGDLPAAARFAFGGTIVPDLIKYSSR